VKEYRIVESSDAQNCRLGAILSVAKNKWRQKQNNKNKIRRNKSFGEKKIEKQ